MHATARAATLERGALSPLDLLIAGMSYMAPGFSLFFTTAIIASLAGIYIPLTYLFAGIGVLCTGAALSEFSRLTPSAGSLQTFVGRGFGTRASIIAGVVVVVGYLCLQAGVAVLFGGWGAAVLAEFVGLVVPWQAISIVGVLMFTALMVRGVQLSIRTTWILFLIEFIIVLLVALGTLLVGGDSGLSGAPVNVLALDGEALGAIALGMVFATFSFVGFEGAISFAEETPDPRRALPIAVLGGIVAMVALYVVATYATVVGFGVANIEAVGTDPEPIRTLAARFTGPLVPFLQIAILTSLGANLMAAGNANARILFNLGRMKAVPAALGSIHSTFRTPHVAIAAFMVATLVPGLVASLAWDYLTAFGYIAGFGALLALLVYMVSTVALPFHVRRAGTPVRLIAHVVLPSVGAAVWLIPLWGALQPGQPFPFDLYPALAVAVVVLATVYALFIGRSGAVTDVGALAADHVGG